MRFDPRTRYGKLAFELRSAEVWGCDVFFVFSLGKGLGL